MRTPKTLSIRLPSIGEETLALQLRCEKILFEREYKFHDYRKWSADFYIEKYRLLIEVEGGVMGKSRHKSDSGYQNDCDKYNEAQILGFRLLRFTTADVKSGKALELIKKMIMAQEVKG